MARILVIEDEEMMRELLRELLQMAGYEVIDACDGAAAFKTFRMDQIDLVITDIIMDRMNGLEVIQNLRRQIPGLKIIAISGGGGMDAQQYLEMARSMGVAQTLAKPFDPDQLLGLVRELVPGTKRGESRPG